MDAEVAPVSVIIPTFNEEANIAFAIRSVLGWASEIFVVDSFSTDRTIELAIEAGEGKVQIVQHRFENYSAQWNWALSRLPISQPWVMKLDADERATPEFRAEVSERLSSVSADVDAFMVHWLLVFQGKKLRWGGLFPNGNFRIWRHGRCKFDNRGVNEHLVVQGERSEIWNPIEHHDYKSLGWWLDRHNRYSSMEARSIAKGNLTGDIKPRPFGTPDERRMWLRHLYFSIPARPFWYFCYRFFLRFGFLDGRAGFRFAFLHAAFLYWIDLKREEYLRTGIAPEVTWPARGTPHPAIKDSELQRFVDAESDQAIRHAA